MENLTKKIVVPVDGSRMSLNALDYIDLIYGPKYNLEVTLLYILPSLPPILTEAKTMDSKAMAEMKTIEKKNIEKAEEVLEKARVYLVEKGFDQEKVKTLYKKKEIDTAKDICDFATFNNVNAVIQTRRSRSDLETIFLGGVSSRVVSYCKEAPVWMVRGGVHSKNILVCVDNSENALRAVDHAASMLAGTDCHVTLFHSIRNLSRFVPSDILKEAASSLEHFWKIEGGQIIAPNMEKARQKLLQAGFAEDQISTKVVDGSKDAATDIVQEAQDGDYGTIVVGKRGLSMFKEFVFGSVTRKLLQHFMGAAVWVVQ